MDKIRCQWVGDSQIYKDYHDNEWGKVEHDDYKIFEMLMLECMQAGLSWIIILKKREEYRKAFDNFDPEKIIHYDSNKVNELMNNEKIIRNRLKINAIISNAKAFINVQQQYGSFDKMIWSYVDNKPIIGNWKTISEVPSSSLLSEKISKDLKKMGFKFVGSKIIYSFMQSIGMLNDHINDCFVRTNFEKH